MSGDNNETPGRITTKLVKEAHSSSSPLSRTRPVVRKSSNNLIYSMLSLPAANDRPSPMKKSSAKASVNHSPSHDNKQRRSTVPIRTEISPQASPEQFVFRRAQRRVVRGKYSKIVAGAATLSTAVEDPAKSFVNQKDYLEEESGSKQSSSNPSSPITEEIVVRRRNRRNREPGKYLKRRTDVDSLSSNIQKKVEQGIFQSDSISENEVSDNETNTAIPRRSKRPTPKRRSVRKSLVNKEFKTRLESLLSDSGDEEKKFEMGQSSFPKVPKQVESVTTGKPEVPVKRVFGRRATENPAVRNPFNLDEMADNIARRLQQNDFGSSFSDSSSTLENSLKSRRKSTQNMKNSIGGGDNASLDISTRNRSSPRKKSIDSPQSRTQSPIKSVSKLDSNRHQNSKNGDSNEEEQLQNAKSPSNLDKDRNVSGNKTSLRTTPRSSPRISISSSPRAKSLSKRSPSISMSPIRSAFTGSSRRSFENSSRSSQRISDRMSRTNSAPKQSPLKLTAAKSPQRISIINSSKSNSAAKHSPSQLMSPAGRTRSGSSMVATTSRFLENSPRSSKRISGHNMSRTNSAHKQLPLKFTAKSSQRVSVINAPKSSSASKRSPSKLMSPAGRTRPGSSMAETTNRFLENTPNSSQRISEHNVLKTSSARRRLSWSLSQVVSELDDRLKNKSSNNDVPVDEIVENGAEEKLNRKSLLAREATVSKPRKIVYSTDDGSDTERLESENTSVVVPETVENMFDSPSKNTTNMSDSGDELNQLGNSRLPSLKRKPLRKSVEPENVAEKENEHDNSLPTTSTSVRNEHLSKSFKKVMEWEIVLPDRDDKENQNTSVKQVSANETFSKNASNRTENAGETSKRLASIQPKSTQLEKAAHSVFKEPAVVLKKLSDSYIQRKIDPKLGEKFRNRFSLNEENLTEGEPKMIEVVAYSSNSDSSVDSSHDFDPESGTLLQTYAFKSSRTPSSIRSSSTRSTPVPVNRSLVKYSVNKSKSAERNSTPRPAKMKSTPKSVKMKSTLRNKSLAKASSVRSTKQQRSIMDYVVQNLSNSEAEGDAGTDSSRHSIITSTPFLSKKNQRMVNSKSFNDAVGNVFKSPLRKSSINLNDSPIVTTPNKSGIKSQQKESSESDTTIVFSPVKNSGSKRSYKETPEINKSAAKGDGTIIADIEDNYFDVDDPIPSKKSFYSFTMNRGSSDRVVHSPRKNSSKVTDNARKKSLPRSSGQSARTSNIGIHSRKRKSTNAFANSPAKKSRLSANRSKAVDKTKVEKVQKPKLQKKKSAEKPFVSRAIVKGNVTHYIGKRLSPDVIQAFNQKSENFFKTTIKNLEMLEEVKGSGEINESDVLDYFITIGLYKDKNDFIEFVRKNAPMEYRAEIIPCARAGNEYYPKNIF